MASIIEKWMEFREVYDTNLPFVWRSLRRLGVPDSDAADAAQEVFGVVFRKLSEFEGRAKSTTWLFRICMHVASERARRAHVQREVFTKAGMPEQTDPHDGPSKVVERLEDLELFEAALGRMQIEQRAVFTLFELESMTGDEVAETLEIPLGTVYPRLRAARESRTGEPHGRAARESRTGEPHERAARESFEKSVRAIAAGSHIARRAS